MSLSKSDMVNIGKVVDEKLDEVLDAKLTQLKSDIFDRIDPVLKEVVA